MNKVSSIIKDLNPFSNKKVDNKIIYTLKILLSAFVVYFASLIIAEGIIIGGSYLFGYNATDKQMPYDIMLLCTFYGYLITILLFILFTKKINKIELNKIGLDKNIKTFLKGILIGIVSLSLIIIPLLMCGAIKFNGMNNNIDWLFFVLYLFGYLIQSFMEELICRGYLLQRLKEKIPVVLAITISVLFFSVGHFDKMFVDGTLIGIIGIINLLLISLIFVVITLKNKNIYGAIGFHFIWNFALFSIIGLNLSGLETTNSIFQMEVVNKFLTGYSYGIESSFITTIILIIILLLTKRNVRRSLSSFFTFLEVEDYIVKSPIRRIHKIKTEFLIKETYLDELMLQKLGKELGEEKVHPHKFRRTIATKAIDKEMPIEQVQHLLGHTKIDTTLHYAFVNQNNIKISHRKYIC